MVEKKVKEIEDNDIAFASKIYPVKEISNKDEFKPVEKKEDSVPITNVLTFDAFFEILKTKNSKIKEHHKNAIKAYFQHLGKLTATEEEFNKILENY